MDTNDVAAAARADLSTARQAVAETAEFLRESARPWYEADGAAVADEPVIVQEAGRIQTELAAAEAAARHGGADEARLLAGEVALDAASYLFAAGGTSTADDPRDFGRHWRAVQDRAVAVPLVDAQERVGRAALGSPPPFGPASPGAALEKALAAAHRYAEALAPGAGERDRKGGIPRDALEWFGRTGLAAAMLPEAVGGGGVSFGDAVQICRLISRADASIGQVLTIHYSILESISATARPDQREAVWSGVLEGARLGNAAAERGVAHAKITRTRLMRDDSGVLRLVGQKFYTTGAHGARWTLVLAVDDEGQMVSVLLPNDAPGFTLLDDWRALGQRCTGSGGAVLDHVAVDPTWVLPRWINADAPSLGTASANLAHVALDQGIAEAALRDLLALWRNREADRFVATRIGRLAARVRASGALLDEACARRDALAGSALTVEITQAYSLQVSIAKVYAGELAVEAGAELLALGGAAVPGLDRHWRDARTHSLHDPSRWRYHRVGEFALHGRLPPRNRTS